MSEVHSPAKGAVVLTGASGGIGLASSRLLREHGFRVFGTHLPSEDTAKLTEMGVVPVPMEITDPASVRAARDRVAAQLDGAPLSGLVNNAGIADGGPIELFDLDSVRKQLDVNVFGIFAVTQAFLPLVRAAKGRIVNISSMSGRLAVPFLAPYCACKFAVEAFSDCLRREMYPFGVGVVVIQPAQTRTPIWDRAAQADIAQFRGTPYESVAEKVKKRLMKGTAKGLDPVRVGEAVLRALTEPNPPTRIPVLKKKTKYYLAGLLPDRIIDRMVARQIWE
jgi:NAD(P)-dependent dehydrogenase (short-subunit alcohol dehydrogenase family)